MLRLRQNIQRFYDDDNGNMSIELVLMTPLLVWVLLSTFVYFDLFRTEANAHRISLTLADIFSREQDTIVPNYLDGTEDLFELLSITDDNPDFRVTVFTYDQPSDTYSVVWSEDRGFDLISPGGDAARLTDDDLDDLQTAGRLPIMANNDRYILVETRVEYPVPFSVGLGLFEATDIDDQTFENFIVIRPRFNATLCWDPTPSNGIDTEVC